MKKLNATILSIYILLGVMMAVSIDRDTYEKCGEALSTTGKLVVVFAWAPLIPISYVYAFIVGPAELTSYCD